MIDNQISLLIFICFISFSSVFCKNTPLSPDDLRLTELSLNDGMYSGRYVLPEHQQQFKNRYNSFHQQPLNKDELNEGRKRLFDARLSNLVNENDDHRPRMKNMNLELMELNNERITDEKLRNLNNLLNRPLKDDLINRQTRSDQSSNKQRSTESALINLLNQDFLRALGRDLMARNPSASLRLNDEDEFLEYLNDKPQKKLSKDEIELVESKQNKNSKELKDDKSTKQLITNNSNYIVDSNQQQSTIPKDSINNRPFRKNKLSRVSKSANKFVGNNVSDCIKNCVSQGILHPVQCHTLC